MQKEPVVSSAAPPMTRSRTSCNITREGTYVTETHFYITKDGSIQKIRIFNYRVPPDWFLWLTVLGLLIFLGYYLGVL